MISGVAQVVGMKPIFRSFFSSAPPLSWAMACRLATGNTLPMAAMALPLPTARKKRRRTASCGNSALTRLASMKSLDSASNSAVSLRAVHSATACSADERWRPQLQPIISGRSASQGLWRLKFNAASFSNRVTRC
jgi:hypothetical protein